MDYIDKKPLISILMGIYNCENTLEEAVQCIIDQTYTNWELIMCDDCSTDNTKTVANNLAERDKRIILLENTTNLTLAPSLNKCLNVARGEYIARMDGDDICARDRFEKELLFLENHPQYALVSCQMNLFDSEGLHGIVKYIPEPQRRDFVFASQFCHAGCMMRIDVMRKLGGYSEDKKRQRVEDYDLWIRLYESGNIGYNLQEPLYSMRDDNKALKRRNFQNRMNEARVKFYACRKFKLSVKDYVYVLVPIIKWFVPTFLYNREHRKSYKSGHKK